MSSMPGEMRQVGAKAQALARLGEDDRIYAINVGERKLLPISAGKEIAMEDKHRTLRS